MDGFGSVIHLVAAKGQSMAVSKPHKAGQCGLPQAIDVDDLHLCAFKSTTQPAMQIPTVAVPLPDHKRQQRLLINRSNLL